MRSWHFLLLGAAVGGALTLLAVIGTVQERWWLVTLAAMVLLTATLLLALDADRRVRALRAFVRSEVAKGANLRASAERRVQEPPPVTSEDVVGTVRALQAQYTGRLDRIQDTLEATLRHADGRR